MDMEMMMQLFAYALGIVLASSMLFVGYQYLIPFLKAKIGNEQYDELVKKIKRLGMTREWPIMGLSIPVEKGKLLCVGIEGNSVKCGVLTQGGPRPIYYEDMSVKDQMSVYNAVNDNLKSEY